MHEQEAQHANILEVLETQRTNEAEFRDRLLRASEKLEEENAQLKSKCQKQEALSIQQQEQFKSCSDAVEQAKKVLSPRI